MHAIEMTLECIDVGGPEPAERRQPRIQFLERFGCETVQSALGVHGGLHQAGVAQHAQVFRHRGLWEAQVPLDLAHRLFGGDEEPQNRAAVRLGNDVEDGWHGLYIPLLVYACQGMCNEGHRTTVSDQGGSPIRTAPLGRLRRMSGPSGRATPDAACACHT